MDPAVPDKTQVKQSEAIGPANIEYRGVST